MIQFLNAAAGTATTAEMLISFLPMVLIIVFMIVLIYLMAGGFQGAAAAMGGKD